MSTNIINHINALEVQLTVAKIQVLCMSRKYPSVTQSNFGATPLISLELLQIYNHKSQNSILFLYFKHELGVKSSKSCWT